MSPFTVLLTGKFAKGTKLSTARFEVLPIRLPDVMLAVIVLPAVIVEEPPLPSAVHPVVPLLLT